MTRGEVTTLVDLCMDTSLLFLESATFKSQHIFLPEDLCEAFISKRLKSGDCNDNFLSSFSDPQTSRVVRLNLKGASITDKGLEHISCQPIRELNISSCKAVTQNGLKYLHRCKNTLTCLNLGHCCQIYEFSDVGQFNNLKFLDLKETMITQEQFQRIAQGVSNLMFLNLSGTLVTDLSPLQNIRNLTTLDLSECTDIRSIKPLECLKGSLVQLVLYNCDGLHKFDEPLKTISQLMLLQHLDLSKDRKEYDMDMEPPYIDGDMLHLLSLLPNLMYLDISGTAYFQKEDLMWFHLPHRRLHFLGLCITDACYYPDIPADVVTGDAGEKQIIESLRYYVNRPRFLINAMRELFNLVRSNLQQMDSSTTCDLVLNAMRCNMADHKIQIAGSASLYHLSRDDIENQPQDKNVTEHQRREIITVTLDAMENHIAEEQLQKNCCLTLCNFRIPTEVEFTYKRVARVLLQSAVNHRTDFIQRIAIGLCNLLVCQVHDDQKVTVGRDLGGVKMVLQVLRQKLDSNRPDQGGVLECCWSALWNVTDETPENCALFIQSGGMELFLECKSKLGHQRDLLRNMLGLMGNVSEVNFLRPHLMKCADVFYNLLDNTNELEVSYNAAGILCHMAFDGPELWTCPKVTRERAMEKLVDCIEHWDIGASRQMSYRSFAPILRLLCKYDTPAIQHWGTWALANLCNVDPDKYCALVISEGGIPLLEEILVYPNVPERIREYTQMILTKCRPYINNNADILTSLKD